MFHVENYYNLLVFQAVILAQFFETRCTKKLLLTADMIHETVAARPGLCQPSNTCATLQ